MSRFAASLVLALVLTSCAGPGGPRGPHNLRPTANPSAVIAAELAFARMAQEKGQWTAFADTADDDATMFVPEPTNAKTWLKGRANPPQAVAWQPYQVWSSCDGSLAVTKGAWQRANGTVGYFTTVWRRQRNGEYKWILDRGDALQQPLREPEMIQAQVADCDVKLDIAAAEPVPAHAPAFYWSKSSNDQSLSVESVGDELRVRMWQGGGWQTALSNHYAE